MSENFDYLQGMKRKVGWFILLGLGVLLFTLIITGARSNIFAKKFYVYVEPPTATSFQKGLPVRFQGFGIGYVDLVELLEQGKVRVTLQLLDRYRPMLHQGAVVTLDQDGLLGERFVLISAGDKQSPILEDKMLLAYEKKVSIEQLLEDLKPSVEQVDRLLHELVTFTAWINDPYGTIHETMGGLKDFSRGLRSEDIASVLSDLRQVMSEIRKQRLMTNLSRALGSSASSMDEMKPFLHEVGQNGGETLQKVDALLLRMQKLADQLTAVSSDAGELTPELPSLAREIRQSLSESQLLMRAMRKSWLFGDNSEGEASKTEIITAPSAVDLRP